MFPQRASGGARGISFALAFAMHCLLFAFLFFGIRWQSHPPVAVEAELWTEPPRAATPAPARAPAPVPPKPVVREEPRPAPPAPPKPDIAVKEEARKPVPRKEEKAKVDDDPIQRELRKEELKQQLAREAQRDQMAQKAASDTAVQGQKAAQEWADRVKAKVRSHVSIPVADAVPGNPEAIFEVAILPSFEVASVKMVKSSGNAKYDEYAERAIKAASPFPPAGHGTSPPRMLTLRMKPKD
jgi:colicin import membrane protein